jgi:hypothetical protein
VLSWSQAPWSPVFELFKVKILKFWKIWEKNLAVDNDDFYRRKKYQINIFYIMDYVKISISRYEM